MNATVARIVEIMFQDTVMSDEVQAIKDEVMNNCQERFDDLVQRGMSEDDAIAAVVESLKGMEEVIAEYPRKQVESSAPVNDLGDADHTFAPDAVDRIKISLTSDDIHIERSEDDLIHVIYDPEDFENLKVFLSGRELKIERDLTVLDRQSMPDTSSLQADKKIASFFSGISKALENITIRVSMGGDGDLTVAVPDGYAASLKVNTSSGDVEVDGVEMKDIEIMTISGDIDVETEGALEMIRLKSTSGDIDLFARARELTAETISGDMDIHGSYPTVTLHSTSGDMDVYGKMKYVNVRSISGDIDLNVEDEILAQINSKTTSGDLTVRLPAAMRGAVAVNLNTVSGDKHNRFGDPVRPALATINAQSVSGDVTVM